MKSLITRIVRKWDWWIYCRALHSIRRIAKDRPGFSYLMEIKIHEWNKENLISKELKSATERFHGAMKDHNRAKP